ncbi:MAG TPA: hypothetical protein VKM54_11695 [Myxococcota bacterium]|nr:hypothetical protein [Myxococcota bacterium]
MGLVGDRLQLGAQRLLALAQRGHALPQLLDRQELFLISVEQPLDAFIHTSEFPLQALLPLCGRIRRARRDEAAVEFLPDQCRILE